MEKIFLLFTCDIWKGKSSMALAFVGTSTKKLKQALKKAVENDTINYGEKENRQEQVKKLLEDWNNNDSLEINKKCHMAIWKHMTTTKKYERRGKSEKNGDGNNKQNLVFR